MANQKPKMSVKKKLGIAILVLVSLPIIYTVFSTAKQALVTHRAKAKVTAARLNVESSADQKVAQFEAALVSSGIATTKIASSKVDVCYVDHRDQGWFAANWYQDCYLRYVNGYETNYSKKYIKENINSTESLRSETGTLLDNDQSSFCKLISLEFRKINLVYMPSGIIRSLDYECIIPSPIQGDSTITPAILDKNLAIRTYVSFDSKSIPNSNNQVWFEYDAFYYHEDLGCGFDFIFCGNPRDKPAQAK
jgi:hypothetical protein